MLSDKLSPALERAVLQGSFETLLARHGADLTALADVPTGHALLARLDAERPYSAARDALLADLLRLRQRTHDVAVLSALLYALHESATRRGRWFATRPRDRAEAHAQVVLALVESLDAFDVDHRSTHVQAGLEYDTFDRLREAREASQRCQDVEEEVASVAKAASDGLTSGTYALADLLGPREVEPRVIDEEDRVAAQALLPRLVMDHILRPWEALLVIRADAMGHRIADVARDLGMTHAAASKTLQRARKTLRARRARVLSIFMSHFSSDPHLPK